MSVRHLLAAIILSLSGITTSLDAQGATRPAWKGIWEAVSYPEDIYLNDVFFVNPDVGWVTSGKHGEGGMLLHTSDAGANWTVQIGDHESKDPAFFNLYFLDERQGWVLQQSAPHKYKLLGTSDGQSWQQVGAIEVSWGLRDYQFLSRSTGFLLDGNDNVSRIQRTTDGGRTWRDVFHCKTKLTVDGLSRDISCALKALHFPTPDVGYAIGGAHGAKRTLFVAKTEDAGNTWTVSAITNIGADLEVYHNHEVFFTDANTGFAHLAEKRLYRTTDGGRTWTGLVGTPGPEIRFADPEVGWSFFSYKTLSYTTDGGNRWTSRELPFPATVNAFSIPRRNRAYVVGEHGMIFRYSVVPSTQAASPNAIASPAMPAFESELDDRVEVVDKQVETLENQLEAAAASAADTAIVAAACCAQSLNTLESSVNAITPLVPQFLRKYRNVNLIIAGLQFLGLLPDHLEQVKAALKSLRQARGPTAAAAALTQLSTSVDALSAATRQAFQKEPMQYAGSDVPPTSSAGTALPLATPAAPDAPEASNEEKGAEDESKKKLASDAAKKVKDEAKKRIKVRFP